MVSGWYWYFFEDGYCEYTRGYDKVEKQHMVAKHGAIRKIERA